MKLFTLPLPLTDWLARRFLPPKRPFDFPIGPDPSDPYMARWYLIPRNRLLNVYLHHVRHSDDDRALHDHPWWSLSVMLRGALIEVTGANHLSDPDHRRAALFAGDVVFRSGRFAHRLEVRPRETAWTLFITGPRFREWGFYCPASSPAGGWRPWREFCDPKAPGQPGRGCE